MKRIEMSRADGFTMFVLPERVEEVEAMGFTRVNEQVDEVAEDFEPENDTGE